MTPTDTLREAVRKAIISQVQFNDFGTREANGDFRTSAPQIALLEHVCMLATDAALSAIEAAGWRVVPMEPTPEMIRTAVTMFAAMLPDSEWPFTVNIYRAMLASAPRLDATVRGEEG